MPPSFIEQERTPAMSKRTLYTIVTPLPSTITRATAIAALHNHSEMIQLNPLVIKHIPCPPHPNAPADEFHTTWYSLTDRISYFPGIKGKVNYKACFHDLPRGLQTHVYAPAGLDIKEKWSIGGNEPGERREVLELGLVGIPRDGLYLREDVDMRCSVFLTSFVKKNLRRAHSVLVDRLVVKADMEEDRRLRASYASMNSTVPSLTHSAPSIRSARSSVAPRNVELPGDFNRMYTRNQHDPQGFEPPSSPQSSFGSVSSRGSIRNSNISAYSQQQASRRSGAGRFSELSSDPHSLHQAYRRSGEQKFPPHPAVSPPQYQAARDARVHPAVRRTVSHPPSRSFIFELPGDTPDLSKQQQYHEEEIWKYLGTQQPHEQQLDSQPQVYSLPEEPELCDKELPSIAVHDFEDDQLGSMIPSRPAPPVPARSMSRSHWAPQALA